ncbi:MAG: hypothetical protein F6K11_01515 [Leptolyngbya sp. SIO3F4]|nr:hypothetical protein [Leptolyngbya sp. SIO3F4]
MLPAGPVTKTYNLHPPNVLEVQTSMCQAPQPNPPQPIARWIVEEGQLLGVLIASFPSSLSQTLSTCG